MIFGDYCRLRRREMVVGATFGRQRGGEGEVLPVREFHQISIIVSERVDVVIINFVCI
jgi:hypothetical protein